MENFVGFVNHSFSSHRSYWLEHSSVALARFSFPDISLIICYHKHNIDNRKRTSGKIKQSVQTEARSSMTLAKWITILGGLYFCKNSASFIHLSSASPRGLEDPWLMWGLSELCISKFLHFPTCGGFFFTKVPSIWQSKAPN